MKAVLHINIHKLKENAQLLNRACQNQGIDIMAVTKGFSAHPILANALAESGLSYLADARIENLIKLQDIDLPKVLLRMTAPSEIQKVIQYADISLQSELKTIHMLSKEADTQGKTHSIILMADVGELREGVLPDDIMTTVAEILTYPSISIKGLGTTLTCVSGVIPDPDNLGQLLELSHEIESRFNLNLDIVSGGNSSSYYLVEDESIPFGINNLRLGEVLLLGRETAYGRQIQGLHDDVFTFEAEIVELKSKPSLPQGKIGMDAFGRTPVFEDKGIMTRALLAIGLQDVEADQLTPLDGDADIIGASSDYILVDLTHTKSKYKIGDTLKFKVDYGGMMRLMSSEFVVKQFHYE